jgi:hypothetical protein
VVDPFQALLEAAAESLIQIVLGGVDCRLQLLIRKRWRIQNLRSLIRTVCWNDDVKVRRLPVDVADARQYRVTGGHVCWNPSASFGELACSTTTEPSSPSSTSAPDSSAPQSEQLVIPG